MAQSKGYPDAKLNEKLRDRYMRGSDANPQFTKDIRDISMTMAHMCYQCGTCTGGMPVCTTQHLPDP